MKIHIKHLNHEPSASFTALVKQRIESLREALQIDEAHVFIERRLEASPAFQVKAHLVTPGPDVSAEAVDHTLRAALGKMFGKLEARIDHRHQRCARRARSEGKKASPTKLASVGARD